MKVLLFSNDGCGSCVKWKPVFERLMKDFDLKYEIINQYDPNNKEIVNKYDVHGIPYTLFLDKDGNKLGDILGNMIEEYAVRDIKYYIDKEKDGDRLRKA